MSLFSPVRLLAVMIMVAVTFTITAGIAAAHVTVNPATAVAGSYTKLTFQVPNESAKADTVRVTVHFPVDHPFASVAVKKEPGWTAAVTTTKLSTPISDDDNASITQAVASITWTADATGRISLGEFAEFDVSIGPVPRVPSLAFDAAQTYSDGSVVEWNQPTPAGGQEPEHPAPTLQITGDAGGGATATPSGGATSGGSSTVTVSAIPVAAAAVAGDNKARTLAVVGIIVGAVGLLVAAVAVRRRAKVTP